MSKSGGSGRRAGLRIQSRKRMGVRVPPLAPRIKKGEISYGLW
jgi:hypothetical protein